MREENGNGERALLCLIDGRSKDCQPNVSKLSSVSARRGKGSVHEIPARIEERESRIIVFFVVWIEGGWEEGDASPYRIIPKFRPIFHANGRPTSGLCCWGETRGGHRDKTSGNWRNSAVILPVMFYPPHTYTLSGIRPPPLCLCVRAPFHLLLSFCLPTCPSLSLSLRLSIYAVCAPFHADDVVKS